MLRKVLNTYYRISWVSMVNVSTESRAEWTRSRWRCEMKKKKMKWRWNYRWRNKKNNKLNSEIVQASNNNNSNKNDKSRKNFKFEKKINVKAKQTKVKNVRKQKKIYIKKFFRYPWKFHKKILNFSQNIIKNCGFCKKRKSRKKTKQVLFWNENR